MFIRNLYLNFDPAKAILKIRHQIHILINGKSDYSEENTSDNKDFHSTILQQTKSCDNESCEKKTAEAVVRRYSSK